MTAESVHSRTCSGALVAILPARRYVADERPLTVASHRTQFRRSVVADGIVTLGMLRAKQHRSGCCAATLRLGDPAASPAESTPSLASLLHTSAPWPGGLMNTGLRRPIGVLRHLIQSVVAAPEKPVPPIRPHDPTSATLRPLGASAPGSPSCPSSRTVRIKQPSLVTVESSEPSRSIHTFPGHEATNVKRNARGA
jgi:hypothetical protein